MWRDFLDNAVDSAGAAGWKWFEKEYGLTHDSLEKLLLENQEIAEDYPGLVRENVQHFEENKRLKEIVENTKGLRDNVRDAMRDDGRYRTDVHYKRTVDYLLIRFKEILGEKEE